MIYIQHDVQLLVSTVWGKWKHSSFIHHDHSIANVCILLHLPNTAYYTTTAVTLDKCQKSM